MDDLLLFVVELFEDLLLVVVELVEDLLLVVVELFEDLLLFDAISNPFFDASVLFELLDVVELFEDLLLFDDFELFDARPIFDWLSSTSPLTLQSVRAF